jgi:hypothetical protein
MASLEYFVWIQEILELEYGRFQMLCSYVVGWWQIIKGSNPTLKWDEYGFTLVNFERLILPWFNHLLFQCMLNMCFLHRVLGQ